MLICNTIHNKYHATYQTWTKIFKKDPADVSPEQQKNTNTTIYFNKRALKIIQFYIIYKKQNQVRYVKFKRQTLIEALGKRGFSRFGCWKATQKGSSVYTVVDYKFLNNNQKHFRSPSLWYFSSLLRSTSDRQPSASWHNLSAVV